MLRARPILWDIYEEHLDEAAFLWGEWHTALKAANYTIAEVAAGPEERLLAHLDGLVLGGKPVGERLLMPALEDDDPGKVAAAAWALVQAEDADHLDQVVATYGKAKPLGRAAIGRALELSTRADLPSRLAKHWQTGDERLRGVIFETAAQRDPGWASAALPTYLATQERPLLAAVLRAARRVPDSSYTVHVARALEHEDPGIRAEAIATGFVMQLLGLSDACQREAQRSGEASRLPLALLALSPAHREFVMSRLDVSGARRHALYALGFAGDVESADAIVARLADEDVAKIAGEALSAITGVVIAGAFSIPGARKGPDVEEIGLDDPPPEVHPEDHLLLPNPETLRKWWQSARAKLPATVSHLYGRPRGRESLSHALSVGAMWRRTVLALESASMDRRGVSMDLRNWTRRQT